MTNIDISSIVLLSGAILWAIIFWGFALYQCMKISNMQRLIEERNKDYQTFY